LERKYDAKNEGREKWRENREEKRRENKSGLRVFSPSPQIFFFAQFEQKIGEKLCY
jgi:hypothetical protein